MKQLYKEWLLELVIKYGITTVHESLDFKFLQKAFELNHMVFMDDDEFHHTGYCLTPNAAKFIKEDS
jgi:hypothetical protein